MGSLRGSRDPKTGRVLGFQSEAQRQNFMIGRARFCNGPNREMPRCTALTRLGKPCRAARMRNQQTCFRHNAAAGRGRLVAAHLSGDLDRIQRAKMRAERNRLCVLWRRNPCEPGRTIVLIPSDEATCHEWAARQGFQLELLDRDLPAISDALRWIWARTSRGLINEDDLALKLARLRSRMMEVSRATDHQG